MIVALENIRSLGNVGAIMRSCEFFGIKAVWLAGYTGRELAEANTLHHKLAKTALGAEKNLTIKFIKNSLQLIKLCQKLRLSLIAVEQHPQSIPLQNWQPLKNSVLVFGSETGGVSGRVLAAAAQIVEIPRRGRKNSLNVATCAGIILNHAVCHL
jgi:tRNA G18 (ribose-2'-O)-methylase SpoU